MKTITNRLKEIMTSVTSPNQCSFVPGRQITDSIFIYQEVLHSMRKKIKIRERLHDNQDRSGKSYDHLSWQFIRDALNKLRIPKSWENNIMHCVQTTRLAVVWNGKQLSWIKPSRGIRQGDAILPY